MMLKYNVYICDEAISTNLNKITNQIYKLLPSWEEGLDWNKPLVTIVEELAGMSDLFLDHQHSILFHLLCKLQGLFIFSGIEETTENFLHFRRIIFECLNLINELKANVSK